MAMTNKIGGEELAACCRSKNTYTGSSRRLGSGYDIIAPLPSWVLELAARGECLIVV
jgi:hypothetical protein